MTIGNERSEENARGLVDVEVLRVWRVNHLLFEAASGTMTTLDISSRIHWEVMARSNDARICVNGKRIGTLALAMAALNTGPYAGFLTILCARPILLTSEAGRPSPKLQLQLRALLFDFHSSAWQARASTPRVTSPNQEELFVV